MTVPCECHGDDPAAYCPRHSREAKPEWVIRGERNTEIVHRATGVEGHAIRCGWAVLEMAGLHGDWTDESAASLVGKPFRWLGWPNEGAIVAAEPQGQAVRVEVWAVP